MDTDNNDMSQCIMKHDEQYQRIQVMIVEDHPLFLRGLCRVIEAEQDMKVIAEVASGEQGIEVATRLQPDIILMDINLPEKNGLQVTREICARSSCQKTNIIILTAYHENEQLLHALRAGAPAYYSKDVRPSKLLGAIRAVAEEKFVIKDQIMSRPQAVRWLMTEIEKWIGLSRAPEELFAPLSTREMEILVHLTGGAQNQEIAHLLGISPWTVRNHLSNVLNKLGVEDRTQAALLALRRGWVRSEELLKDLSFDHFLN